MVENFPLLFLLIYATGIATTIIILCTQGGSYRTHQYIHIYCNTSQEEHHYTSSYTLKSSTTVHQLARGSYNIDLPFLTNILCSFTGTVSSIQTSTGSSPATS